jgi:short-subunit dehydrogenase
VVHGCKFFLPILLRESQARIVNISSVFGLFGPPGQTAYCSSKYAVRGFSESLREELRGTSVKVTCVHPAGIATHIADNARAGAATRVADQDEARKLFAQVARITPETAAQTIINGILADKGRVLIGRDAQRIDFFSRLMPTRASALLTSWMTKRRENRDQALAAGASNSESA